MIGNNIKELEKLIKEKGYNIKVLYYEEIGGEYWIVYTTDIDYTPKKQLKNRQYLEEKEEDIIAVDIEDAVTQIVATLKGGAK